MIQSNLNYSINQSNGPNLITSLQSAVPTVGILFHDLSLLSSYISLFIRTLYDVSGHYVDYPSCQFNLLVLY